MGDQMLGQMFGNYKVTRKLGEGGMGAVFEGVHQQLGRHAAIKVLHPQMSQDPQMAQRFFNGTGAAIR